VIAGFECAAPVRLNFAEKIASYMTSLAIALTVPLLLHSESVLLLFLLFFKFLVSVSYESKIVVEITIALGWLIFICSK